jgi:ABC-type antimicrobial peptide transport system permease subunit
MMRALIYFTVKDLLHDAWRSLLTVLSLMVMVLSFLMLSTLSRAYLEFGKRVLNSSNLVIISADVIDPMESSLSEAVLDAARAIAPNEITNAFPEIFRHLNIEGQILQVVAVQPDEMNTGMALELVQGDWPSGLQDIAISEGVLHITPWKIGSVVNVYGTDFRVIGILRAAGNNYASVWMTYSAGQHLFGPKRGFQMGIIQLDPAANPETVRLKLQKDPRLSANNSVYLVNSLNDRYSQINHNLLVMSGIQAFLSLLAITFGTYNANSLSLVERSREVVLLRLIGFTRGKLSSFLFVRSLVLTGMAYCMGWIAAALFINYQQTHTPINIQSAPLLLRLTPTTSLVGLGLAIGFALLGIWMTSGYIETLGLSAGRN